MDNGQALHPVLYQENPTFNKPSIYKAKGWTETVEGYLNEAKQLAVCLLRNRHLMRTPYTWFLTINFESVLSPSQIKKTWEEVCRKLRSKRIVALWVREVSRSNKVHYHLLLRNSIHRPALEAIVADCLPDREALPTHTKLQVVNREWRLVHYLPKAKIAGFRHGEPVEDYYADKRLLFLPNLGLKKFGTIGSFWERPKKVLWQKVIEEERRISEAMENSYNQKLVDMLYVWFDGTESRRSIERSIGWHADYEGIRQWVERIQADGGLWGTEGSTDKYCHENVPPIPRRALAQRQESRAGLVEDRPASTSTTEEDTSPQRVGESSYQGFGSQHEAIRPRPPPDTRRYGFHSAAIEANCSIAACKSSAISCASTSGSGRLSASSRVLSLIQKMSRLSLSRFASSSYVNERHRPSGFFSLQVAFRWWRFSGW